MSLQHNSDTTIYLDGPTNAHTGALSSGGTCDAYLFHDRKDTTLSANELIGQTVLSVEDASQYEVNVDVIMIQRDDKVWHNGGLVTEVDLDLNEITITTALAGDDAAKGNLVGVLLGTVISMAAYGTPAAGTFDWGYFGTIQSTHAGLQPGIPVREVIILDDSGVVLTKIQKEIVEGSS